MFPLAVLRLAAAGAIVGLTAASLPARADELAQNLGPDGEPILIWVGSKRVIALARCLRPVPTAAKWFSLFHSLRSYRK